MENYINILKLKLIALTKLPNCFSKILNKKVELSLDEFDERIVAEVNLKTNVIFINKNKIDIIHPIVFISSLLHEFFHLYQYSIIHKEIKENVPDFLLSHWEKEILNYKYILNDEKEYKEQLLEKTAVIFSELFLKRYLTTNIEFDNLFYTEPDLINIISSLNLWEKIDKSWF